MSSPKMITRSSRSISSASASVTAFTYRISGIHVLERRLRRWPWALPRELRRPIDLGAHLGHEPLIPLRIEVSDRLEPSAEARDRVLLAPRGHLFLGAVRHPIALVMAVPSVRHSLDERRPLAPARSVDRRTRGPEDGQHVVAVDAHAPHPVPGRAFRDGHPLR